MKRTIIAAALAALVATPTIIQSAQAGTEISARKHHERGIDANGNEAAPCIVRSGKTGASARVGCAYVARFQAYVDELEANGATVHFMGGYRPGHCSPRHMHSCNRALDVCQLSRGRVDTKCRLPGRQALATIAERHGLFEGGQWCHSDYGHAQVGVTAGACGTTLMAKSKRRHRAAMTENAVVADWRGH